MNKLNQAMRMCIDATNALIYAETNEQHATAKLMMDGAQAAFREALADHVEQNLTMVADHSGDANEMVAEPAIPEWVDVDDYEEPVKQEPVAWGEVVLREGEVTVSGYLYGQLPVGTKLYTTPPSVEAAIETKTTQHGGEYPIYTQQDMDDAIAETLEKAAKVCEGIGWGNNPYVNPKAGTTCAAAIRSMK